ncbi:hypothetical protein ASG76_05905 [Nocardioides sp. Soil774]|uniref:glycosyltransferase n=1 Tax=Nocardioides sp. Soil774 TaxID=1736408 RepID=UPI0006FA98B9|nr:glycosyltransferase [Nocardioides sp. Soil774]KRE95204.1 hypothetical protein ASG76_05905 [Nocardioides sp. Soil774]
MRVLFSSTFGYGHVLPMLPLAKAFGTSGHSVLWATSAQAIPQLAAAGIATAPAGLTGEELHRGLELLHARAAQVAPSQRAAFMFPRLFGALLTPPMAHDLLALARRWHPDLLIHEHGELASPLVGAVLGRPSVTHAFGGAIPAEIVRSAAEAVEPVWAAHGHEPPPYLGCFTSLYLDICPRSVQSVPMGHVPRTQPLRPASPRTMQPPRDDTPLVYLTLGTVQNQSPVLPLVASALATMPIRLLVAVGPDGDAHQLSGLPDNVRIEKWVDQAEIIDQCALVVSHAGSGTFLGALAAGRPQLCLPMAADQFRNAAGGKRVGAVLVLEPDDVSPESVVQAATRLLTEESFLLQARAVSTEIAEMPSPSEVVEVLAALPG